MSNLKNNKYIYVTIVNIYFFQSFSSRPCLTICIKSYSLSPFAKMNFLVFDKQSKWTFVDFGNVLITLWLCLKSDFKVSLFYYLIYFCYYLTYFYYYSWIVLFVLFISFTVLFQLSFTFIYNTFSKKFSILTK